MPKKVTHADAQLILQLYDLRREAEMRKARNWVATQFWPQSADDYIKVASAVGTPENDSDENLITLCTTCHAGVHHR